MFPYRFFALFWSFLATSQDADWPSKKLWKKTKLASRPNLILFLTTGLSALQTEIVKATFVVLGAGLPTVVNTFPAQPSGLFCGMLGWVKLIWKIGSNFRET